VSKGDHLETKFEDMDVLLICSCFLYLILSSSCIQLTRYYKRTDVRVLPEYVLEEVNQYNAFHCVAFCGTMTDCITASWSIGTHWFIFYQYLLFSNQGTIPDSTAWT